MATPRRSTDERRAQITDAAIDLIATRGIAALSTASLAAEVSLTTGALFRHFPSFDAILVAVAQRAEERLAGTFPSPELPPLERLAQFFVARTTLASEKAGIPRLVLSDQLAQAVPEEARKILQGAVLETRRFVTRALEDGQRQGAVRTDVEAEPLAMIVMGTMQVVTLAAVLRSGRAASPTVLRETLFRLISTSSTSSPNGDRR